MTKNKKSYKYIVVNGKRYPINSGVNKPSQDNTNTGNNNNTNNNTDNNKDNNNYNNQNRNNQGQNNPQDGQSGQQPVKISPQQAQQMLKAIQAKEKETQDKVNKEKAEALKSRQKDKNW